jgi:hypothetical protein
MGRLRVVSGHLRVVRWTCEAEGWSEGGVPPVGRVRSIVFVTRGILFFLVVALVVMVMWKAETWHVTGEVVRRCPCMWFGVHVRDSTVLIYLVSRGTGDRGGGSLEEKQNSKECWEGEEEIMRRKGLD